MAINVSVESLYANPRAMTQKDKEMAIEYLPGVIDVDKGDLRQRLDKNKYFVWIKRKIPAELAQLIKAQKITGLGTIKESKRYYPNRQIAAHIIGFAGVDNQGLEGIELSYNEYLKGEAGQAHILRDAKHRELLLEKNFIPPQDGHHLVLTIDDTIQFIAEWALEQGVKKAKAKAGSIIILNPKTGEILALANWPTYNLDKVESSNVEDRTNRAISFVYEPGSIFKIIAASAALEEGKFVETDKIFCENGEYKVGGHILHDHHPLGMLTFSEVFKFSSNIGVAKIAQKLGQDVLYKYIKRYRIGIKTDINIAGEVNGLIRPPSAWSKTSIGAIPMGHEVTVTPLQMVSALGALANDGIFMRPYIVKEIIDTEGHAVKSFDPAVVDRVISPETARRVKDILIGAVEEGTGKNAIIKGIKVAGKTGTAQKVVNGNYAPGKFYSSFMGFAPADNPQLAAIVVLDEAYPRYFGGTVCAPIFKEAIENSLNYLTTIGERK